VAFLDKKNRIIDITLTDHGRQLLSENSLDIKYYAFSDDLIDYSGSLAQSVKFSQSLDDVIYRNFIPIAASQMKGAGGTKADLTSFLYTAPEQRTVLPQFTLSDTQMVSLVRLYEEKSLVDIINIDLNSGEDFDFVVMTDTRPVLPDNREKAYAEEQNLERIEAENPQAIQVSFK
jgi:hypothetical protein